MCIRDRFYGYLPFMVLPLYSTLEKTNWTLLEAAADLGANGFRPVSYTHLDVYKRQVVDLF